jgi:hypothetical protein
MLVLLISLMGQSGIRMVGGIFLFLRGLIRIIIRYTELVKVGGKCQKSLLQRLDGRSLADHSSSLNYNVVIAPLQIGIRLMQLRWRVLF